MNASVTRDLRMSDAFTPRECVVLQPSYDLTADALYIVVRDGGVFDRTLEIEPGMLVDVDANDLPLGIEILNPGRVWDAQPLLARFAFSDDDRSVLVALGQMPHGGWPL